MMKSLYSKFILFTVGIMLISALIAFLAVNTFYHQQLKTQNDEKNIDIALNIKHHVEENNATNLDEFLQTIAKTGYKLALVDENHGIHFFGEAFRKNNLSETAINQVLHGENYHGMRDFPKETFVTGFFSDEVANTVGVPFTFEGRQYAVFLRPDIKMLFTEIHYLLGGMFIVMGIVSLFGMIFLARQLIKPIVTLTAATEQIGHEELSVALPTNRNDEIGQLAGSFQSMTEELAASDQLRKQFINDVTHDFQTPLQNIQGYADLLDESEIPEADRIAYTAVIQSETKRLSALTKQLLLLTTLDALTDILTKKQVNLTTQINHTIQKYRWQIEEKNIFFMSDIADCTYKGDPAFLEKIWDNLISNAIKYSLPDGLIELQLAETDHTVIFSIKDNGIGINEDQIPFLFDRFYRADSSRHSKISGTGLGLPIVKQVVQLHDGTMKIESELGIGTHFQVTFPKEPS